MCSTNGSIEIEIEIETETEIETEGEDLAVLTVSTLIDQ
jgi:hypothetical protein